ncbi:hypothetical protein SERLA73DRAFT_183977, partial [Serpula lacrymans var. lacrymans S7.3]
MLLGSNTGQTVRERDLIKITIIDLEIVTCPAVTRTTLKQYPCFIGDFRSLTVKLRPN